MAEELAGDGVTDAPVESATPADAPVTPEAPAADVPAEPSGPSFDWVDVRGQLTGGDEAMEKVIGRYRSLDAFGKAFMAQRQKLSERADVVAPTLADDATPEQIAEYRQLMGIPDEVGKYDVGFGEGFEFSDADAAALDSFKEFAHQSNMPPAEAKKALDWYQGVVEAERQQMNENADAVHSESSDALKAEWGREFDANQNAIKSYLDQSLGADKANELRSMRMADGSMLMDNADVLRLLVQPATDYMGGDMMIAGDTATMAKTLSERKNELLALRLNDPHKYKSQEVQDEITSIYAKLEKLG